MKILFFIATFISLLFSFTKINKGFKYTLRVLTVLLVIMYFSFLNDYFKYLDVLNDNTHKKCIQYFEDFPNGRYYEEVRVIEIEILKTIELVRNFIDEFPESGFLNRVKIVNYELWQAEINNYNSLVKNNNNFDYQAVSFFRELLYYMRDNNRSNISLKLNGNINVKDFEDYPVDVIKLSDVIYNYSNSKVVSGNVLSLKSNYSQGNINNYEKIINESILESFQSFFSARFVTLGTIQNDSEKKNDLIIEINYNINNQEDLETIYGVNYILPRVWIYTQNDKFDSYILGVSISFDFDFSIPGTNKIYQFKHDASPLSEINNINDISDGYRIMTSQNFKDYTNIIIEKFGLIKEKPKL